MASKHAHAVQATSLARYRKLCLPHDCAGSHNIGATMRKPAKCADAGGQNSRQPSFEAAAAKSAASRLHLRVRPGNVAGINTLTYKMLMPEQGKLIPGNLMSRAEKCLSWARWRSRRQGRWSCQKWRRSARAMQSVRCAPKRLCTDRRPGLACMCSLTIGAATVAQIVCGRRCFCGCCRYGPHRHRLQPGLWRPLCMCLRCRLSARIRQRWLPP